MEYKHTYIQSQPRRQLETSTLLLAPAALPLGKKADTY
jgi:hypothetical protein